MTRYASLILALSLSALTLGACAQQRAVHRIEISGDRAADRGDYELSADEYREVIDRRPNRWDVRRKLAQSLLDLDRPAEAREQLEVAYTIRPTNPEVLDLLATAMLESGDVESMTRELRFAAEESGRAADWYRLGVFLSRAGDDDSAESALKTAARLDGGEDAVFQTALARFYESVGDDAQALERYRMALYLAPDDENIQNAVRAMGRIPGPTFGLVPKERASDLPD